MYHRRPTAIQRAALAPAATEPPAKKPSKKSKAERRFREQLERVPNLKFLTQLHFATSMKRRWRFDFAFPDFKVAVELDGVVMKKIEGRWFTMGRHADVKGMRGDAQKGNAAIMYGWSVLHFLQDEVSPKRALNTTLRVLAQRGWRA
jgi:very-short-patch-repair endonuclease